MSLTLSIPHGHSEILPPLANAETGSAIAHAPLPTHYSRLIAEISARMVRVSNEDLDTEIFRALREALLPLGVDRGGLLEVFENSPTIRVTHAWYNKGVRQVSSEFNLAEMFPWSYRRLVLEGQTKIIVNVDDLPPEAEIDRQSHLLIGTVSDLCIPLFIGERVHHLLAVNTVKVEREWPLPLINHLRMLGEIIVSALQRREADLALRQTKDRLNYAADAAGVVFWELDIEGQALWANDQAFQLFGFDPREPMSLSRFLEKVHPEDRKLILQAVDTAQRTGNEVSVEYRSPSEHGQERWMVSRGQFLRISPSAPRHLMGITMEITKQKLMEQQLQEQLREIERLREQLEKENAYLRNEMATREEQQGLLNASDGMQSIMAQVEQVAGTNSTVLIQGETGTGKEVLAQAIHRLSARSKRVMVKVNCAALPAALVESELFGREKGAFTGALSRQMGRFEMADGSTLFLDEIAEMPLETQAKLLRVLQEGEFERLGSPKTIKVDVRIIAASNRDLAVEVEQGRLRRDLFYRLNVFPIHLPPLRERPEDIPQLVWQFVNEFGEKMGKKIRRIANRDMEQLKACAWPGNIRELRNVIEHALIVSKGETLELRRLATDASQPAAAMTLEELERQHIQEVLKITRGKVKGAGGAAERLGINPSTLYSRMLKLGIQATRG